MAATELARILHAVNRVLEESSSAVGLSKRAALALAVMAMEPDHKVSGRPAMTNQGLKDRFVRHRISEEASAKKDASAAKGELLEANCVEIVGKVSVFAITPAGQRRVEEIYEAMGRAIEELRLADDERALLRKLVGLPPLPTGSEAEGKTEKKSASSEGEAVPKLRGKSGQK